MALERLKKLKLYLPRTRLPSLSQIRDGSFLRLNPVQPHVRQESFLKEFESACVWAQEVCVWSSPVRSLVVLLLSQWLLYKVTTSSSTLASLGGWSLLLFYLYHTWVYRVWPAIRVPPEHPEDIEVWTPVHPDVMSAPELGQLIDKFNNNLCQTWSSVLDYRQLQPGRFCIISCSFFTLLALTGGSISITVLLHTASILLLTLPGIYIGLSKNPTTSALITRVQAAGGGAWAALTKSGPDRGENELEEFLPESTSENETIMEKALGRGEVSSQGPDDSLTVSLVTGLNIPAHDEVDMDSINNPDMLEEDLAPVMEDDGDQNDESDTDSYHRLESLEGRLKGVDDSDTDSMEGVESVRRRSKDRRLSFKTQHYEEFSSSEEDDLLPILPPSDTSTVPAAPPLPSGEPAESLLSTVSQSLPTISSMTSYLPSVNVGSLFSGLVSSPANSGQPEDLDDFELISEDELEKEANVS